MKRLTKEQLKLNRINRKNVLMRYLFCSHVRTVQLSFPISMGDRTYMKYVEVCKSCGREF